MSLLNNVVDEFTLFVLVTVVFGATELSLVQASNDIATISATRANLDKFFMAFFFNMLMV